MALIDLFPYPKQVEQVAADFSLRERALAITAAPESPLVQAGIDLIQESWDAAATPNAGTRPQSAYPLSIALDAAFAPDVGDNPEAYQLELLASGGRLSASTEEGLFLGCQTVRQLLVRANGTLPSLRITDWPDLAYRGLYLESKWGPDLMALDDWQELIDDMASLKLNSLGVGVYGCWIIQYGGKRTEFLMVPFPEHPQLTTPKTLRYYSPADDAWVIKTYLPPMVDQDLFGKIVAYAKSRHVTVRPHFNSPGHNTLLPRTFPAVASRDVHDQPKGFGFCLSNPRTYELIFSLYDSVIDRYLASHGIDWFHIGLDEVSAYPGIDEADPTKLVDPWCECAACQTQPRGQQLQNYAIRVCTHLREKGIQHITMWNDALDGLGVLDDKFGAMLSEAGLSDHVVVQWWRYHTPVLVPRPEIGVRAWSTAMGGYWSNLTVESLTANIYDMITNGARAGAEGADVYCIYDRANDRNYRCLAQFAWNAESGEDLYQFKSRYARSVIGGQLSDRRSIEAFSNFDQAFDAIGWTNHVLASLLYYWHTYPAARAHGTYPQNVIATLRQGPLRLNQALVGVASHAAAARDLFAEAGNTAPSSVLAEYMVECDKVVGLVASLTAVCRAANQFDAETGDAARVSAFRADVSRARDELTRVMAGLQRVKAHYLQPQILRDLSILWLYFDRLGEDAQTAPLGTRFDDLATNHENLDQYVSTEIEPSSSYSANVGVR